VFNMTAGRDPRRPSPERLGDRPTFSLERFGWGAPDRLEVAGTFSGLSEAHTAEPVLAVHAQDGTHRLPAISELRPPIDGARWTASFAWMEPPVAFEHARLELGAEFTVDLPAPGEAANGDALAIEPAHESDGAAPAPTAGPHGAAGIDEAAQRLRLEAQLLEAAEQLEETRATARRAEEALARVQADLSAERERHTADAERFREGLAKVRASAEEALGAAAAARSQAQEQAQADIAALRERVAALEPAGAELGATRAELEAVGSDLAEARGELDEARSDRDDARSRLDEARSERDDARSGLDDVRGELDAALGALADVRAGAQELLGRLARVPDPSAGRR
jgi:hypothetical protein